MNARTNEGFLILDSIHAGNSEFVLGINMHVADSFVTWKCDKGTNYDQGFQCRCSQHRPASLYSVHA